MNKIEIRINHLPRMTNSIRSWRTRMGEARKWKLWILEAAKLKQLIPEFPIKRAKLTLVRHSSRQPDSDGLVSGFKHVIDALVEAQILVDDGYLHIGMPDYKWEPCAPGLGFIEVIVEEILEEQKQSA